MRGLWECSGSLGWLDVDQTTTTTNERSREKGKFSHPSRWRTVWVSGSPEGPAIVSATLTVRYGTVKHRRPAIVPRCVPAKRLSLIVNSLFL